MSRVKTHVRRGDQVLVLSGKNRGQKGKVLRVLPGAGRAIVEGVNIVKRHQRPTRQVMQGGIVEKEAPVHLSSIMLICPRCNQPTRVGKRRLEDGRRLRVCKRCGETIEV